MYWDLDQQIQKINQNHIFELEGQIFSLSQIPCGISMPLLIAIEKENQYQMWLSQKYGWNTRENSPLKKSSEKKKCPDEPKENQQAGDHDWQNILSEEKKRMFDFKINCVSFFLSFSHEKYQKTYIEQKLTKEQVDQIFQLLLVNLLDQQNTHQSQWNDLMKASFIKKESPTQKKASQQKGKQQKRSPAKSKKSSVAKNKKNERAEA